MTLLERFRLLLPPAVIAASATCLAAQLPPPMQSTFATDSEGWVVGDAPYTGHVTIPITGGGAPQWDASTGNPAASIRIADPYPATAISAPPGWLGDKQLYYGSELSCDIYIRLTDGVIYPAFWLVGADKTLVYNLPSPPVDQWWQQSTKLTETGWLVDGWQGPPATRADMMEVLSDLRAILINTEWNTGNDDTNVDNIRLLPPLTGGFAYGAACPGSNGLWPTLWTGDDVTSGGSIDIQITDGPANLPAVLFVGDGPIMAPFAGCTIWILPYPVSVVIPLDATGAGSLPLNLPTTAPGAFADLQALCLDPGAPSGAGLTLTNSLWLYVQ